MEEDGLVQELRAAGRPESQGRFTLDLAHALQKLREHRLRDPHEYILALLSAAVRSGATLFDVTPRSGEIAIQFDGEPFRRVELEGLFSHLLGGPARPAVLELAAGIHAALALNPASLHVDSGGHRLTIAGGEENLKETSSAHTCVHILWHLDLRRWVGLPPELPILRRRGRWAPLRRSRGGEPLPEEPLDLGPCLAFRVVRQRGQLRWIEPPSGARSEGQGPVDAVLALGAAERGLTVVMAGVSYEVPGFAGPWRAVAGSEELRPDLSRSGPVEDALTLHREAQLVRSRSAQPDRSRSLLYETTALLALGRPGEAFEALTPGFPEPPLLDVLAEACLRTEAVPLAAWVLVQGLEARRWPAMPRPEPEDQLFLAMVDEVLARKDPGDPALRRLARLRSGAGLLLPAGPAEVFEFTATAHEYAAYGSLDLAVNTLRRATHRLDDDGSPLHRALLAWQVALLRRLGRPAEADLVWARLQLLTAWAAGPEGES